jgi:uncharacterized membrane protein
VRRILENSRTSLAVGLIIAAAMLVLWMALAGSDALSLISFLIRLLHILAAAVWIGLMVFVNFVLLAPVRAANGESGESLYRAVAPGVGWWLRQASTGAVASGGLLLLSMGYLLPTLVYGSGVYVPLARAVLIWSAVPGALAMWMFVHMYMWPAMLVVLGLRPGDAEAKARAALRVAAFARLNLLIMLPVSFAMIAAAHLY